MGEEKPIYTWYLIISIIYSSLMLVTAALFVITPQVIGLLTLILTPVSAIWIIFSIIMFILILTKNIERIALLLPGLYVFDFMFSIVIGVVVGVMAVMRELNPIEASSQPIVMVISSIFPAITLGIAIKLLMRK